MAKYSFSVEVDSGLKPAGENDFPLAQAKDIVVDDNGKRLSEKLPELELPKVTAADNGKVLSVAGGAWAASNLPTELPKVGAADNGKILTVEAGKWSAAEPDEPLPTVTDADNGKVLSVSGGAWSAAEPPSGLPEVTAADNGKYLGVHKGQWVVTGQLEPDPDTLLPYVKQEDNGKVLSVVNGAWAAAEAPSGGMTIPVYDFAAMGMPPIVVGGEAVMLETDTTQLMQDLANGVVTFKVNFTLEDMTIPAVKTCGGFSSNEVGIATITGIDVAGDIMVQSVIMIQEGGILAMAHLLDTMINAMIDAYMEDALGGDY